MGSGARRDRAGSGVGHIQSLLQRLDLQAEQLLASPNDVDAAWIGMPEFEQPDQNAYQVITVRFRNQEDVETFARIIGQPEITEETRTIWFPKLEKSSAQNERYVDAAEISDLHSQQRPR